jgi:hypothetical protein
MYSAFLRNWQYLAEYSRIGYSTSHVRLTIYTWKYDGVTWTLQLKRSVPHIWSEILKVIIVPVDPIIDREPYVTFWVITDKVQPIFRRIGAFHQADGLSIS